MKRGYQQKTQIQLNAMAETDIVWAPPLGWVTSEYVHQYGKSAGVITYLSAYKPIWGRTHLRGFKRGGREYIDCIPIHRGKDLGYDVG